MTTVSITKRSKTSGITRVLICAGDRDNRVTLGILLRSEGYVVQLAKDGAESLNLAAAYRPDVALLDLEMPDRSGYDVAQEFQRRYGNDCPFLIALAIESQATILQLAEISGFHHLIAKPYAPQELLDVLASLEVE